MDMLQGSGRYSGDSDGISGYDSGMLYGLQLDWKACKAFCRWLSSVYGSDETFFVLQINGAARWIGVGGFSVSLSLMSWLFLPLYGAVLYRYREEGYGAVLKAVVWMLPIVGFLITCPDSVMAGTVGLSCIFMLMLASEKGWYQVAVRKVMAGLGKTDS